MDDVSLFNINGQSASGHMKSQIGNEMGANKKTGAQGTAVCVLDFGAIGDGLSDDTRAIQLAMDSGASHVMIPPGTFMLSNVLRPGAGQCIEIHGTLKICDAVIQQLQNDVAVGDSEVIVENGSQFEVGQWVTLHDEQLPVHLMDWASDRNASHGATYQTRRIYAGNARIVEISGNTLTLDDSSSRSYLCSQNACIGTQHSAILIEHSHVRICGTGVIDGNKDRQLDTDPSPLAGGGEENRAGCGIKVVASDELTNIVIEGITVRNAILHNISFGNHNSGPLFPESLVSDSVIRNVRSVGAHDKNIAIGRCRDCSIIHNFVGYAEYEDGIVFHQVSDGSEQAACRIQVQGNRCVGNARNGLHIGANNREIFLADNVCIENGFNLVINGDDCTSCGDVAMGYNGRLFPMDKHRPNVLIAGRRVMVNQLTVLDSHGVAVGISGQDNRVAGGLIGNTQLPDSSNDTIGIAICPGSACDESLYPGTGLQPTIVPRQADVFGDGLCIRDMKVRGFVCGLKILDGVRRIVVEDNDLQDNAQSATIAPQAWKYIRIRGNKGLRSRNRGVVCIQADQVRVSVLHGLCHMPDASGVSVTPVGDWGHSSRFWIEAITEATFDIVVDCAPTNAKAEFAWQADLLQH